MSRESFDAKPAKKKFVPVEEIPDPKTSRPMEEQVERRAAEAEELRRQKEESRLAEGLTKTIKEEEPKQDELPPAPINYPDSHVSTAVSGSERMSMRLNTIDPGIVSELEMRSDKQRGKRKDSPRKKVISKNRRTAHKSSNKK